MHIDISIDEELIQQAMQISGLLTEREVIEKALRLFISQQALSTTTDAAPTDPLWQLIGMAEGEAMSVARHHDQYLYDKPA